MKYYRALRTQFFCITLCAPAILSARETVITLNTSGPYHERISVADDGLLALELVDPTDSDIPVRAGRIIDEGVDQYSKALDPELLAHEEYESLSAALLEHGDELISLLSLQKPGNSQKARDAYAHRMECFKAELEKLPSGPGVKHSFDVVRAAAGRCGVSPAKSLTEFAESMQALGVALACDSGKKSKICSIQ